MVYLAEYDKYLIEVEKGIGLVADAPARIRKEIEEINEEYREVYGEDLIQIPKGES